MMEAELIKCLSERFYSDFADTVARRVRDAGAVGLLYEVVTSRYEGLPRAVRHKVAFRGAYVLEKIYFDAPDSFMPCAGKFCGTDFPACDEALNAADYVTATVDDDGIARALEHLGILDD